MKLSTYSQKLNLVSRASFCFSAVYRTAWGFSDLEILAWENFMLVVDVGATKRLEQVLSSSGLVIASDEASLAAAMTAPDRTGAHCPCDSDLTIAANSLSL